MIHVLNQAEGLKDRFFASLVTNPARPFFRIDAPRRAEIRALLLSAPSVPLRSYAVSVTSAFSQVLCIGLS
jgi:hypothetical protein